MSPSGQPSANAQYYVMGCEGIYPGTTIGKRPKLPRGAWMTGEVITYEVVEPLVFELDANYPGELRPMYPSAAPLMREDLLSALREAGVDNLQLFSALLNDPMTGKQHTNYKAVNIVGVVSAADMGKSKMMGTSDSTLISADFEALVFREQVAADLLLFRLAESVNAIVVHERVKHVVEARAIPGMTFFESGEWSG
jgi:hypothetical protein